jgi:hypothetical protein
MTAALVKSGVYVERNATEVSEYAFCSTEWLVRYRRLELHWLRNVCPSLSMCYTEVEALNLRLTVLCVLGEVKLRADLPSWERELITWDPNKSNGRLCTCFVIHVGLVPG